MDRAGQTYTFLAVRFVYISCPDGEIQNGCKYVGCDDDIWNFWIL